MTEMEWIHHVSFLIAASVLLLNSDIKRSSFIYFCFWLTYIANTDIHRVKTLRISTFIA